jgi:hypothetical protein
MGAGRVRRERCSGARRGSCAGRGGRSSSNGRHDDGALTKARGLPGDPDLVDPAELPELSGRRRADREPGLGGRPGRQQLLPRLGPHLVVQVALFHPRVQVAHVDLCGGRHAAGRAGAIAAGIQVEFGEREVSERGPRQGASGRCCVRDSTLLACVAATCCQKPGRVSYSGKRGARGGERRPAIDLVRDCACGRPAGLTAVPIEIVPLQNHVQPQPQQQHGQHHPAYIHLDLTA